MQNEFVKQHSDDGDMVIRLSHINAARLSRDSVNAEVLLSDGTWVRTSMSYTKLQNML